MLPHLRSQARRAPRGNVERLFAERGAGGKKEGKKKNQQTLFLSLRDSAKASLPSAVSWEAPGPGLLNSSSRLPPPPSAAQFPPAFGASSRHGPEPPALLQRSRLDLLHLAVAAVGNEGEEIPNEWGPRREFAALIWKPSPAKYCPDQYPSESAALMSRVQSQPLQWDQDLCPFSLKKNKQSFCFLRKPLYQGKHAFLSPPFCPFSYFFGRKSEKKKRGEGRKGFSRMQVLRSCLYCWLFHQHLIITFTKTHTSEVSKNVQLLFWNMASSAALVRE